MARAIWSGVLTFGLVSVPVELYSATETHGPVFHQFEKGTSDRIRYQRVNERTDDEVEYSDVVKGADTGGGNYVLLDQDELEASRLTPAPWGRAGLARAAGCGPGGSDRRPAPWQPAGARAGAGS